MSKQLAESLIRLGGLYFMVTSLISLGATMVVYLQSNISDRTRNMGMGVGDLAWAALAICVGFLVGAIILKKSNTLAALVVREDNVA
ncbi:MAG: hypothetical protein ACI84O_000475 [Myxococcota bacterium]|jgi:hypothetical protein